MKVFFINLLFIFLIITFSLAYSQVPKDFGIFFKFGFHKSDATTYDSRKKMLVVQGIDTVMNVRLKLSSKEIKSIYNELQKINFNDYPEKYSFKHSDTAEVFMSTPCKKYFLTVTSNNKSKIVEWDKCIHSRMKDESHVALMKLDSIIEKYIWAKKPLKDYHPTRMRADPN